MDNQIKYNRFANYIGRIVQKNTLSLLAFFMVGLLAGASVWWLIQDNSSNGKQKTESGLTQEATNNNVAVSVDDKIQELQYEILFNSRNDYQVHVQLAELYAEKGDAKSSVASYEFAKKAVDLNDPQYQSIISGIEVALEAQKQRLQ